MMLASACVCALACVSASITACEKKAAPPPTPNVEQAATSAKDLALPRSTASAAAPKPSIALLVSARELALAGDPYRIAELPADPANGLADDDKRDGRADFWITPLEHALRGARGGETTGALTATSPPTPVESGPSLVVIADANTTYRVLAEIVYTSVRAGMSKTLVAAKNAERIVVLPIATPAQSKLGVHTDTRPLLLVRDAKLADGVEPPRVVIASSGIVVRLGDNFVGSGCEPDRSGFAVPRHDGEYDFAALGACLAKIKDALPELRDETTMLLGADGSITLDVVIRAMDAARASFADVALLVPMATNAIANDARDGGAE